MKQAIVNIFSKLFSNTKRVYKTIAKKEGEELCTSCGNIISAWLGGTDSDGNIVRTCMSCCDKENEGVEFKFENDDPVKQVVEYNAYRDGVKIGKTVRIGYFTQAQIDETYRVAEQLRKEGKL